ncbi:hypothetical protein BLA6863_07740 [Burkholderia lata]|uniref:Uncharacterized protein n=1 Tax=Burkholderia lata (strain ATCC 17760 / DSM 23089 / LMG 22485 / NCIMB 9086 / R18194 / 383) TaxID=482957 RepID=A0A6P2SGA0_BURL3|nr:hypothetical protein BLA6863_07740 [Burkholderia lata]
MRSFAAFDTTGPTSVPASAPALTFSAFAFSTSSGSQSRALPTSTTTDVAMQRWPAAPKPAPTSALIDCSRCASGSTTAWFFAPIIDCTRLPCWLPRLYTWVPTRVEPTNEIALMSGCVQRRSTTVLPPCTTFSTPCGTPASIASSTSCIVDSGSCSDGFSTNVLPHTIAIGNIHSGIMPGKLNGVMPAHTPIGWRSV